MLVVSSEQESFGLTLVESMAVATPVVSTRCGGPEEIIEHGVTGLLAPCKDHESMAACVNQLLANPGSSAAIAMRGREAVLERFAVTRYAGALEALILETRNINVQT